MYLNVFDIFNCEYISKLSLILFTLNKHDSIYLRNQEMLHIKRKHDYKKYWEIHFDNIYKSCMTVYYIIDSL